MVGTYLISVTIIGSPSDYVSAGNQFQRLKYSILNYEELPTLLWKLNNRFT